MPNIIKGGRYTSLDPLPCEAYPDLIQGETVFFTLWSGGKKIGQYKSGTSQFEASFSGDRWQTGRPVPDGIITSDYRPYNQNTVKAEIGYIVSSNMPKRP